MTAPKRVPKPPPVIMKPRILARCVSAKASATSGIAIISSAPVPSPAMKREQAELPNLLREPLQCGEDAVDQDAERQRAHPAEIVGDDAEKEAADRPTQEADRGQEAADRADLRHRRRAAEQLGQGLAQYEAVEREVGDVERPPRPRDEEHEPLISGDVAQREACCARADICHYRFPPAKADVAAARLVNPRRGSRPRATAEDISRRTGG